MHGVCTVQLYTSRAGNSERVELELELEIRQLLVLMTATLCPTLAVRRFSTGWARVLSTVVSTIVQ